MGRANGGRGDGERQRRGEGELPEPDLQGADAAEPATLKERGDRVTRRGGGDGQRADRGGPQWLADEIRRDQDPRAQETDGHAKVIERAGPLGGSDPVGEHRRPQGRGRVQDAGQRAADRQLTEGDRRPGEQAAEDGHGEEGQQAGSGPGRERRLPARRKDEPERDGAENRSGEHQRRRTHVVYGELDEEERSAPDQGQRAECEIAASHRTIMRSRYVTPQSGTGWARWRARKYSGTVFMGSRSWSSISFCSIQ